MSQKQKIDDEMLEDVLLLKNEQPHEIPENWVWTRVSNFIEMERGITFPASAKKNEFEDGLIGCARTANIQEEFVWDDLIYVNKAYTKGNERKLVQENDILMSIANSYNLVGKISFIKEVKENITFGGFLLCIRSKNFNVNFIFYYFRYLFLSGKIQQIASQTTNIANISAKKIQALPIPIPPVPEQKRIAEKVERLLGKIDEAKRLIDEAKETLELRRAAILDKAFRGELTKKWREENLNVENVDSIFNKIKDDQSIKRKIIKPIEEDEINSILPSNWKWVRLGDVFKITSGGTPKRAVSKYYDGHIPWVKTGEIKWNTIYDTAEHITVEAISNSSAKLLPKDSVLVAMYGQGLTRGRAAILATETTCNQAVCALLPNEFILPKYLFYYFMEGYQRFREIAKGGNQENLSATLISNFIFPFPPLEEQRAIVEILDTIFNNEDKSTDLIDERLKNDELRASVLAIAFRGELGTNDSSEESAMELLKSMVQQQVK
ncbi:restriction endonuclease subunit S [Sporosarcina ureae]|uniref:restriction endonuclease subunit S n=1 Tax=Sporosarcina ureae TaxID=1571 RepID=UPI0026EACEE9|nr:restriction endonuclease subunit S [Sporosarcina ureae]